ncbi:MAG: hypothetical protein ABW215_14935 [Kibdelosporangium sp.]
MSTETESGVGRSAGKVGIAILVGSVLGYVVTLGVGRLLSPAEFTTFITFWGIIFGLGSALSPLEQEVGRLSAVAALDGRKPGVDVLRSTVAGGAVVALIGLVLLIPPLNSRMFGEHYWLGPVVLAGAIGFAVQFTVRGLLVGQRQTGRYAWLIMIEAAVRPLLIGVLVVVGLAQMLPLAVAVAVGSFAWLAFAVRAKGMVDRSAPGESWQSVTNRMLVLMLGAGLTASVITGYPAVVRLLAPADDEARIGALFAALTIARVPLLMFAAVQALAVPMVVRLSSSSAGLRKLRRTIALGTVGALVLAAVGALVGLLVGPWLVTLLYTAEYQVDGYAVAGLVWSSVLLATVQLLAAVLVARKQGSLVLATWAVVAVVSAVVLLFWPGDTVLRATLGLVFGPTAGLVLAVSFVLRPRAGHDLAAR